MFGLVRSMDNIKKIIYSCIGKRIKVIYNGSRNKKEVYNGVVTEIYNSLFIIKLDTGLNKSFSYADLLTGIVSIKY